MRVYELAKKLGMENRELIPELKRMGVSVSSHSSALDKDTAQKVLDKLMEKSPAGVRGAGQAGEGIGNGSGEESQKAPKVPRGGKSPQESGASGRDSTRVQKSGSAVVEEPVKPEKRRILIKRKKTEEEVAIEAGEGIGLSVPEISHGLSTPPMPSEALGAKGSPGLDPVPAEAPTDFIPSDSLLAPPPPVIEPSSPADPSLGPAASTPTSGVVAPESPQVERKRPVSITPLMEGTPGVKDKLKKTKKVGRSREEEDARFIREDARRFQDLRAIPVHRREDRSRHSQPSSPTEVTKPRRKVIKLIPGLTVKDFAEVVGQRPADIVRRLMEAGQMQTFNQPIDLEIAALLAEGFGLKTEILIEKQGDDLLEELTEAPRDENLMSRPPVVTIMGHVDHGKTSLLDAIRNTSVTEQEAGGITQHIGAYTVSVNGKHVTFLDTPGHEAFTAMRARGAKVTDVVVLVVAADDGVMPQTVEAINHATAANVPIIVAINKIDRPDANIDRVKHALAEHNLLPEAWGGSTIFVEVSAKQKIGLETLLEMILLQAEVLELKADPHHQARGTVIEAKLDRGRGAVATVLVQSGTLQIGDAFVVGTFGGRVRAMIADTGNKVMKAGSSMPVEVVGLPGVPDSGDPFIVVKDERAAREIAEVRQQKQRSRDLAAGSAKVSLDDLFSRIKTGDVKELMLVIKADVQGSAEALTEAVEKLPTDAVKLRVLHRGVGAITETDILLASSSRAIVIGFNIRPEAKAAALADHQGVDIRLYKVIYDVVADIRAAMEGLLDPTIKERTTGRAEVRQVFTIPKVGTIAGCYVLEGTMLRSSAGVRVVRDHVAVYEGKLGSLRRFKDDVREVQQGYECGIGVENFKDLKVGDILEVFVHDEVAAKL